ncbi:MAG: hypothetical protein RLZZ393_1449 [Pseudomonadota bacterium]|jgi:hypothetical protein
MSQPDPELELELAPDPATDGPSAGYDPYDHRSGKHALPKPVGRDLRKLSEWIKQCREARTRQTR